MEEDKLTTPGEAAEDAAELEKAKAEYLEAKNRLSEASELYKKIIVQNAILESLTKSLIPLLPNKPATLTNYETPNSEESNPEEKGAAIKYVLSHMENSVLIADLFIDGLREEIYIDVPTSSIDAPQKKDVIKTALKQLYGVTEAPTNEEADAFLESLTPSKVRSLLPSHELTPQEEELLTYTPEERNARRSGSAEEAQAAATARRNRAKAFLATLRIEDAIELLIKGTKPAKREADAPRGRTAAVNEYVVTKDLLSKAVFGEPGRDGKPASLVRKKPGNLILWTTGKGNNRKNVTIYTRLDPDKEALKAAGITIGKNLSKCARELFGALLSHKLAGNNILSLGMIGEIIYNTRDGSALTPAQKKYIIDGATELFSTTFHIDTIAKTTENPERNLTLLEAQNINIKRTEQVFPGRITSAYINGNLVDTAIELYSLPTLYILQNALERGQILRAPTEILKIPGRTDEDIITIRAYLLRRIDAMKHSNLSRMIIYKNILDELGIDPTDREQKDRRARILKKVERVLDYWTEKGYIHSYDKLTKDGKPVKGTAAIYEIEIRL